MATKVNYRMTVINSPDGLDGYSSPSYSSEIIKTFKNNKKIYVDRMATDKSGIWYREVNSSAWLLYKSSRGKVYLKIEDTKKSDAKKVTDANYIVNSTSNGMRVPIDGFPESDTLKKASKKSTATPTKKSTAKKIDTTAILNSGNTSNTNFTGNVPFMSKKLEKGKDIVTQNTRSFPRIDHKDPETGQIWYDWTINTNNLKQTISTIRKNLNIPSAYTKYEITDLTNTQFNRYKIEFADHKLKSTMTYVVFTRPDLNLFKDNKKILPQISNDPQLYYIYRNNPAVLEQLSLVYAEDHKFIPLLTNQVTALDVSDEVLDTSETGENWAGYKMQYGKSSIRSMTAGSVSVRFPETHDTGITQMFQAWCSYENAVYRGTMIPKTEYSAYKVLDYACDIFCFVMDRDWTIKFWTVYYGAFPTNVNKSIFSYDMGSDSGGADVNVTFNYFQKLDSDIRSLSAFNMCSGSMKENISYRTDIDPDIFLGGGGTTWAGAPFVQTVRTKTGSRKIDELKLRFRA